MRELLRTQGCPRATESIEVGNIEIHNRKRPISEDAVMRLQASIEKIGLHTPISVRYYEERPAHLAGETSDVHVLMTGANRLEAVKRLGWGKIECFVYNEGDETDAELWEIAENLHRAELTALERDRQVARWIELTEERQSVQAEPIKSKRKDGRGHRPQSGISAAARELGIDETDAKRAMKTASLTEEAQQAAIDLGLDDNRSALLGAAEQTTPNAQVDYLKSRSAKGGVPPRAKTASEVVKEDFNRLVKAWNKAGLEARERFTAYIDQPVMDRSGRTFS